MVGLRLKILTAVEQVHLVRLEMSQLILMTSITLKTKKNNKRLLISMILIMQMLEIPISLRQTSTLSWMSTKIQYIRTELMIWASHMTFTIKHHDFGWLATQKMVKFFQRKKFSKISWQIMQRRLWRWSLILIWGWNKLAFTLVIMPKWWKRLLILFNWMVVHHKFTNRSSYSSNLFQVWFQQSSMISQLI